MTKVAAMTRDTALQQLVAKWRQTRQSGLLDTNTTLSPGYVLALKHCAEELAALLVGESSPGVVEMDRAIAAAKDGHLEALNHLAPPMRVGEPPAVSPDSKLEQLREELRSGGFVQWLRLLDQITAPVPSPAPAKSEEGDPRVDVPSHAPTPGSTAITSNERVRTLINHGWEAFCREHQEKISDLCPRCEIQRLEQERDEAEARCCPEDMGFEEYIGVLHRRILGLTKDQAHADAGFAWVQPSNAATLVGYAPPDLSDPASPAPAVSPPGWQPIEGYDKAIHPLDVLVATDQGVGEARQHDDGAYGRWFWANTCDDGAPGPGEIYPTHWLPLPSPPVAAK